MKLGRTIALASVVMGMAALASPGCGSSGLVGGGCAEGLTNCSNMCVDLQVDQYNCGRCGHACTSGVACINGKCGGVDEVGGAGGYGGEGGNGGHYRDGSTEGGDASSDAKGDRINEFDVIYPQGGDTSTGGASSGGVAAGGSNTGGESPGGASSTGGGSSGGASSSGGTEAIDAETCVPPFSDPQHCGDCTTVCPPNNPVCGPSSGSFVCKPMCEAPLQNCFGSCADLNSDSNNCGICGNVCPSSVCQGGACVGAQPGHFVGICMNYRTASSGQTPMVLGNAIFIPRSNPVKVLAYDEYADSTARNQVDATIADVASQFGRQATISRLSKSADLPSMLRKSDFDVLLVYEQLNAPQGELARIGDLWASSLESFTYVGGVIVMLDGGQGTREMSQLFTNTRMFSVTGEVILSPPPLLTTRDTLDVIGAPLNTALPSQSDTCVFDTTIRPDSKTTSFVITEEGDLATARPVVVHLTRRAPQP